MIPDVFDVQETVQSIQQSLTAVRTQVTKAGKHLEEINAALATLEEAGMFPAMPLRESWEPRKDSPAIYVSLYWGLKRGEEGHKGPEGKRKIYIGCKPERIAEARRMAENRRRWEQLNQTREELVEWLQTVDRSVAALTSDADSLARRSDAYPQENLTAFTPVDGDSLLQGARQDLAEHLGPA